MDACSRPALAVSTLWCSAPRIAPPSNPEPRHRCRDDSRRRRRRRGRVRAPLTPATCGWSTPSCSAACRGATSTIWCRTSSSAPTRASASYATPPRSAAGSPPSRANRATRPACARRARRSNCLDELPGGDPIEAETLVVLTPCAALPEAYRDTLLMRLVEGMSGNEIARAHRTHALRRCASTCTRGMKLLRENSGACDHEQPGRRGRSAEMPGRDNGAAVGGATRDAAAAVGSP